MIRPTLSASPLLAVFPMACLTLILAMPPLARPAAGQTVSGPVRAPGLSAPVEPPGTTRPDLPGFAPDTEPEDVRAPSAPVAEPPSGLSAGPTLLLRGVRFDGNRVISGTELAEVAAPFVGRAVSSDDLLELRYRLSEHYVRRGYISSGAVLPDQDVRDGIVTYRIIEGRLSDIRVSGTGGLREAYVADRLALGAGPPLNIDALRERIQLLLQDPLIGRLNAELRPGLEPGDSLLDVVVTRARPYELTLSLDNHASASIGEYRIRGGGIFRNLTGWGDTLDLLYGRTAGLSQVQGGFAVPVTPRETTLSVRFERNDADIVEQPLDELDIRSETRSLSVGIRQPLYRTPHHGIDIGLTLERRRSDSFLLDRPFSFSPGVRDGRSDVAVLALTQDAVTRGTDQVIAGRSSFRFGLDAFNATVNGGNVPDGQFLSWLGQFQWARRLDEQGSQAILRADLQLANDTLLPLERFAIGGADTVRGYRENALVRDAGLILSLEGRIPLFRLPLPGLSRQAEDGQVQLAPFLDYGRGWNVHADTPEPRQIYSVGLGIRWDPSPNVQARLYYGHALRDIDDGDSLQDRGIHFQLVARLF